MASLKKKSIIRWVAADGTRASADAPGATRVKERSAKWYGQYRDHAGIARTVPLRTDRNAARAMLAELETKAARVRAGLEPREAP